MSIEKLATELHDAMKDIMSAADGDLNERQILKVMFLEFAAVGKKKNLPIIWESYFGNITIDARAPQLIFTPA